MNIKRLISALMAIAVCVSVSAKKPLKPTLRFGSDGEFKILQFTDTIEVKVINMWHNRLVGDVQPGVTKKITYTQMEFFKPEEPLLPAGLIGPVRIIGETTTK